MRISMTNNLQELEQNDIFVEETGEFILPVLI